MGKWATYQRRGGGPPTAAALIFITGATIDDDHHSLLNYSADITTLGFHMDDFHSLPSNAIPTFFTLESSAVLRIEWSLDITGDIFVHYANQTPELLSPQSVLY